MMTTRQTSIDCYNQIKEEGLLSKQRFEVYEALFRIGSSTGSEIDVHCKSKSAHCRLSELRDLGALYEKGTRKCKITDRVAIEWDLTDRLPIKIKPSANTKKNRVSNVIKALRELYKNKDTATDEDWKTVADLINGI